MIFPLINSSTYRVLSYAWGQPPYLFHHLICDGANLRITESLSASLQVVRSAEEELILWADAVCIHFLSDNKKSYQIRNMPYIYFQAKEVFIWLGPEDSDTLPVLKHLDFLNDVDEIAQRDEVKDVQGSNFFQREYYQNKKDVSPSISVLDATSTSQESLFMKKEQSKALSTAGSFDRDDVFLGFRKYHIKARNNIFLELLIATRDAEAANDKDKVFTILGLANEANSEIYKSIKLGLFNDNWRCI